MMMKFSMIMIHPFHLMNMKMAHKFNLFPLLETDEICLMLLMWIFDFNKSKTCIFQRINEKIHLIGKIQCVVIISNKWNSPIQCVMKLTIHTIFIFMKRLYCGMKNELSLNLIVLLDKKVYGAILVQASNENPWICSAADHGWHPLDVWGWFNTKWLSLHCK